MNKRNSYEDETPIRLRTMCEMECSPGLDEIIGGLDGEVEEDLVSISECSLEEIELESDDRFL